MLYKKVHRQHIREWRLGREFKIRGEVDEVASGPYTKGGFIWIGNWYLIHLLSGKLKHKDDITWLN